MAETLHVTDDEAQARIAELSAAELVRSADDGSTVTVTDAGQRLRTQIGTTISQTTERLVSDLPAHDLATAGSVLSTMSQRANAILASL